MRVRPRHYDITLQHLSPFNIDGAAPEMQNGWHISLAASQLGIVLQAKSIPANQNNVENVYIRPLFLQFDTVGPFGLGSSTPMFGDVIFERQNHKPLLRFQLDVVAPFIGWLKNMADPKYPLIRAKTGRDSDIALPPRCIFSRDEARYGFECVVNHDILLGSREDASVANPFPSRCAVRKSESCADESALNLHGGQDENYSRIAVVTGVAKPSSKALSR